MFSITKVIAISFLFTTKYEKGEKLHSNDTGFSLKVYLPLTKEVFRVLLEDGCPIFLNGPVWVHLFKPSQSHTL